MRLSANAASAKALVAARGMTTKKSVKTATALDGLLSAATATLTLKIANAPAQAAVKSMKAVNVRREVKREHIAIPTRLSAAILPQTQAKGLH